MEQFEQLLTCCVCLDRYRNPKLLPCQHSFCMEPCMDGLVDYVRRQVKCPECRAEHRIPYNGVQGFPTNVTLTRFLELHIEITGELPDPTSGQIMERCAVCSEKSYCSLCVHCDKKICPDCKGAHMDILRREIVRINNQIRRGIHRLQDTLALVEKNMQNLQTNCNSVTEEIDEVNKRLEKALRDRTHYLKGEVDRYVTTEMKNLRTLKENLELEVANIQSNCDLADKHMNENVEWDDCELVDTKEVFLKTVEFMRNFEYETSDYNRRVRFTMALDPNQLVMNVANYGDLNIVHPQPASQMLQVPGGPGLLRSKSDHRLAAQFRQQEAAMADDEPLLGGRKFGERPQKKPKEDHSRGEYDYDYDQETSARPKSRFRSRFVKGHQQDDSDSESRPTISEKDKNKITSTEDTSKGPLSGIFRLMDSPRVMKRLQDQERGRKEKKATPPPPTTVATAAVMPKNPPITQVKKTTARQLSEDEIDRIKRQNKGSTSTASVTAEPTERPTAERHAPLNKPTPQMHPTPKPTATVRSTSSDSTTSESSAGATATSAANNSAAVPEKKPFQSRFLQTQPEKPPAKPEESEESSEEEEEETSEEESDDSEEEPEKPTPKPAAATPSRPEPAAVSSARAPERKDSREEATQPAQSRSAYAWRNQASGSFERDESPKYGRVRGSATAATVPDPPEDRYSRYGPSSSLGTQSELARSRSTHALKSRENSPDRGAASNSSSANKDGGELSSWARYLKNKYGTRSRENKEAAPSATTTSSASSSSSTPSNTARRLSLGLPLRQANDYSSDDDHHSKNALGSPTSPTAAQALAGIAGLAGMSPRAHYLQKRRQLFQIGGRGSEPGSFTWPRGIAVGTTDNTIVVADSSNHRVQVFDENGIFQKEFGQYGNGEGEFDCLAGIAVNKIGQYIIADRYNHRIQVLDPSGKFIRAFGSQGTADGKFNYPWGIGTDSLGFIYVCDKENHRIQVFQSDGTFVGKFGTCGNKEGQLEHPHYIAVSSNNRVVVSDSNNHRIQIFDINGRVLATMGGEGSEEGQFKFPRGVAVDDQGYIIVADSGNNRIQIFHPDGNFLRSFGSWGSGDAEFKGLEGVAVMKNGSILVCDRENHRVQVF